MVSSGTGIPLPLTKAHPPSRPLHTFPPPPQSPTVSYTRCPVVRGLGSGVRCSINAGGVPCSTATVLQSGAILGQGQGIRHNAKH